MMVLIVLLETPGQIVTREELRQRLRPDVEHLDFEHGLNVAVKKLRVALNDSAETPRYIETLARRGYRFIETIEQDEPARPNQTHAVAPASGSLDPGDLSGRTLSHFRVIDELGRGGIGVVYRAEDLRLGRQVALKFLRITAEQSSPSTLEHVRRRARAAAALSHPNICTVFGVEELAGHPVIEMELLEGETLAARLDKGRMELEEALELARQIAAALEAAHRKGVVHSNVNPANIMLTANGSVKVLDFCLAKIERVAAGEEPQMSQTGTNLGTYYMSPEQVQGKEIDARSDLFSFGLVLYELLSGRRPFYGENSVSIMAAILHTEPAPLDVPSVLEQILKRCLAKAPAQRYQNMAEVRSALQAPPLRSKK